MIKQFQTRFFDKEKGERGDCLRACLSSLTELPIDRFNFHTWIDDYTEELPALGFDHVFTVQSVDNIGDHPGIDGYYIAYGETERPGRLHAVIIDRQGNLVHDPYYGGKGLTKIMGVYLIERIA